MIKEDGRRASMASEPIRVLEDASTAPTLAAEIWNGFRPYFVKFVVDFLIASTLWAGLYLFKKLTQLLEIQGEVSEFIVNLHSIGAVLVFALFALLFVVDVYAIHKKHGVER